MRILKSAEAKPAVGTRPAFTLIDVVVAVLLLGIISAVAVPRFSKALNIRRAEAGARLLSGELNFLRRQAITRSKSVTVTVDSKRGKITCADIEGSDGAATYENDWQSLIGEMKVKANFDSSQSIEFDLRGTPMVRGARLLQGFVDVESGANRWRLKVDPVTGITSVQRIQ